MSKNLLSVSDYADLCGVSRAAIYLRIGRGVIIPQTASNGKYEALVIDTAFYPPRKMKAGRKPFKIA